MAVGVVRAWRAEQGGQMIETGLDGRTVLITGANHGIGAATAKAFAAQGARVFITFFREPCDLDPGDLERARRAGQGGVLLYRANQQQDADHVVREIEAGGGIVIAEEIDLSPAADVPLVFDRCERAFGTVDVLVNNHTYCVPDSFDPGARTREGFGVIGLTAENIDANCALNVRSYALLMYEFVRRHVDREKDRGRIINISTDAAHAHEANVSYAATKHAIESYTRSAAAEVGRYGITVNAVAPGPIQTGYIEPEAAEQIAAKTPLGRVGLPEDVADVIVFFASDQAHWLTGQLVYAGGGWRMGQ